MRPVIVMAALAAILWPAAADAGPYPPVDQKRPPLVLKSHGIFWAGGRIVTRTQAGNEATGDLKEIPYNQQQVLAGQAYVDTSSRSSCATAGALPIVMIPGGALVGVNFLTTPDGREGWAITSCGAAIRSTCRRAGARPRGLRAGWFNNVRGRRRRHAARAADVGLVGMARMEHGTAAGADTQARAT